MPRIGVAEAGYYRDYLSMFFFSSKSRHTRFDCDWSSDVCSSDLGRDDGGINTHHLSVHVEQWPTRVARIDGRIGLDEVIIRTGPDHTAFGAHDPCRYRMAQAKRIADRHHPLADFEVSGVAHWSHREYPCGRDFQHGQIRLVIPPNHSSLIHLL